MENIPDLPSETQSKFKHISEILNKSRAQTVAQVGPVPKDKHIPLSDYQAIMGGIILAKALNAAGLTKGYSIEKVAKATHALQFTVDELNKL